METPPSEIARGVERRDGLTVVLLEKDPAALPRPARRTVDVLGFFDGRGVGPVLHTRPCRGGAAGEQGRRPRPLLVEALARHDAVAVAQVTLRAGEQPAVLRSPRAMLVPWLPVCPCTGPRLPGRPG
ncbi:Ku protein [Actinacidiphila glaucinigra]|uniref:Ku protein n=1 Tax=Actinacidiphila glaucinigra TaxID=235986 RepID=UPI00371AC420